MSGARAPPGGRAGELGRFLEIQNLGLNLPFALAFVLLAAGGLPKPVPFVLVVIAFVAARNAGHSFNRWADRRYDAANPRTRDRALAAGRLSPALGLGIAAANGAIVIGAAYALNPLALALSPVALLLVFGYSYTKRWTALTTAFLGLVEAIVPAAMFVALDGTLPLEVLLAVGALLLWGTAFETIHSLGDVASDRDLGLRSLPVRLGPRRSVALVVAAHAGALALFALFGFADRLGWPYFAGLLGMAVGATVIDQRLARAPGEVRTPFQLHFVLAAAFLVGVVAALFLSLG